MAECTRERLAAARARNERLILWSHEDMALREALYAHDAAKGAPE